MNFKSGIQRALAYFSAGNIMPPHSTGISSARRIGRQTG
jgi:hypothetical protein